ncbi:hypothetical protein FB45DRAFT_510414 [Roridomyces roridus]|uniref:Uncharacterized protein n=1 Tax=Roridomyces roridus TaxID=1738132 RepID=A0AAD7FMQ3_9AGAR|nr:hypothetical protein FB45DRAFT_510414 [Roridomyces roridus]
MATFHTPHSSRPRPGQHSDLPPPPPSLLPPPPALPSTFSSASQSSPAPRLSTRSELKVNWEKILPLIADCVQARKAHQEALDDKIEFGKILGSEYYRKLSETDAAKINEEHERLDEIGKEKGKIVVAKIKSLGETDWWPVGPNEGSADDYRNMVEYAKELAETAKSMHEQYLKNANDLTLPVEPDPRPLKRRRLSDAAVPPMQPADYGRFGEAPGEAGGPGRAHWRHSEPNHLL